MRCFVMFITAVCLLFLLKLKLLKNKSVYNVYNYNKKNITHRLKRINFMLSWQDLGRSLTQLTVIIFYLSLLLTLCDIALAT